MLNDLNAGGDKWKEDAEDQTDDGVFIYLGMFFFGFLTSYLENILCELIRNKYIRKKSLYFFSFEKFYLL